jgi:hypothetical protein
MIGSLVISEAELAALEQLRELAAAKPVDMRALTERLQSQEGKRAHMVHMRAQTILIPLSFDVTFTIELNHPCGTCRHMSMSSRDENRTPVPQAVWIVCEKLGFVGGLEACAVWLEELERPDRRAKAVNVVQPLRAISAASARAS